MEAAEVSTMQEGERAGDHPAEELIERYVRYPDTLDEATREKVAQHLEESAVAREIADFYRAYYEGLDSL